MFRFKRQFKKYAREFIVEERAKEGYYDTESGLYVPPQKAANVAYKGIILQLSDDDLKFDEGGSLTYEDKKVLIDTDNHQLHHNQRVCILGKGYKVFRIADYSIYSHFQKVIVKRTDIDDRLHES